MDEDTEVQTLANFWKWAEDVFGEELYPDRD